MYNPQVQALLKEHQITEPLQEIGRLTTWRAKMITEDAEICLDYNEYREQYDYEVEYEYLRPHDGLKVFQKLLEQIGASYEGNCRSKVMRADRDAVDEQMSVKNRRTESSVRLFNCK